MPKLIHFVEFWNTWSLRSISVTRHVNFNITKIGGKCQNSQATFWYFFKQCELVGILNKLYWNVVIKSQFYFSDEVVIDYPKWRIRIALLVHARSASPSFARPRLEVPISPAVMEARLMAIIHCQTFCECGGYDWIVPKRRRPPAFPTASVIASNVTVVIATEPIQTASCPPHQIWLETTQHIRIKVPKVPGVIWLPWPLWVQLQCLLIKDQVRNPFVTLM